MKHRFHTDSKLFQSIACTVAAVLTWAFVVACGGGNGAAPGKATAQSLIARLHFGGGRAAIYPASKSTFVASMFFQATGASTLGESWQADCTFKATTINGILIGAHAVYGGNSGFAPLNVPFFQNCGDIGVAGTTPHSEIGDRSQTVSPQVAPPWLWMEPWPLSWSPLKLVRSPARTSSAHAW